MPFVERSVQEYGVVIDHLYYYDDVLRPYIHKKEGDKGYIFKRDPRDISVIYFLDPLTEQYYDIPFRNASHPPISVWEYRDSLRKIKERNKEVNEDNIFEALKELNMMEKVAVSKTKKYRRESKTIDYRTAEENNVEHRITISESEMIEIIKPFEDLDDEAFNRKY